MCSPALTSSGNLMVNSLPTNRIPSRSRSPWQSGTTKWCLTWWSWGLISRTCISRSSCGCGLWLGWASSRCVEGRSTGSSVTWLRVETFDDEPPSCMKFGCWFGCWWCGWEGGDVQPKHWFNPNKSPKLMWCPPWRLALSWWWPLGSGIAITTPNRKWWENTTDSTSNWWLKRMN